MKILSIGECMAELAPLAAPGEFKLGFAGDTFNTAWYLRQLNKDIDVAYHTSVGQDDISARMLGFMQEAGIGTASIARDPQRSAGLYLITLNNGERNFSYWRDNSAARRLADDESALTSAMADADLVYFSGITLAILPDDARDRLMRALSRARSDGKTVGFDPNLRPRLWRDAGQMTDAIMQAAAVSDLVLPSYEDEETYFSDADPEATANRYVNAGASTVIVKNGPEPVLFVQDGRRGEVAVAPATQVVDTTSAGDSFNAGFLAGMHAGLPIEAQIELAAAVARQVIGGKGALVTLDKRALPLA